MKKFSYFFPLCMHVLIYIDIEIDNKNMGTIDADRYKYINTLIIIILQIYCCGKI